MKIKIIDGSDRLQFSIPNWLFRNVLTIIPTNRFSRGTSAGHKELIDVEFFAKLSYQQKRKVIKTLQDATKIHGSYHLVEIDSANGEHIEITITE